MQFLLSLLRPSPAPSPEPPSINPALEVNDNLLGTDMLVTGTLYYIEGVEYYSIDLGSVDMNNTCMTSITFMNELPDKEIDGVKYWSPFRMVPNDELSHSEEEISSVGNPTYQGKPIYVYEGIDIDLIRYNLVTIYNNVVEPILNRDNHPVGIVWRG